MSGRSGRAWAGTFLGALVVVALAAAACSPDPSTTTSPTTSPPAARQSTAAVFDLPVGTPITDTRAASAAEVTLTAASMQRNQGTNFLVVTVRYAGTAGTFAYRPYDWRFRAVDGTEAQMSFIDVPNPLGEGTLRPGETAMGLVGFEVPPAARGVVFYLPDGVESASWKA